MSSNRVYLFDTTLRDGAQTQGVDFSVADKRHIAQELDTLGVGYKANPAFALDCLKAAYESGARWIVLCDTNGGTLPGEVHRIVSDVAKTIPGDRLGIHAHNDTENAVANSLAAVEAGVRQIQGTLNGLGERCGNANLTSLIPTLILKPIYADRFATGIAEGGLAGLTELSHRF